MKGASILCGAAGASERKSILCATRRDAVKGFSHDRASECDLMMSAFCVLTSTPIYENSCSLQRSVCVSVCVCR